MADSSLAYDRSTEFRLYAEASPFDEVSIYRAASAFEKAGDWKGICA